MATKKYADLVPEWIELYGKGHSTNEIAELYSVGPGTVRKNLKKKGIELRPNRKYDSKKPYWIDLYLNHFMTINEISRMEGVSHQVVKKYISEDIDLPSSNSSKAKQFDHLKKEWIESYESGSSLAGIARQYGVTPQTVHNYISDAVEMRTYTEASRKYELDESYFDVIDTKEKAYWLGALYSRGCLFNSSLDKGINLTVKTDEKEHLIKFRDAIFQSEKPLDENREDGMLCLRITSRPLYEKLIEIGLNMKKTQTSYFPKNLDLPKMKSFILGYYEGKGGLHLKTSPNGKRDYDVLFYGSESFLQDLKHHLESILDLSSIKYSCKEDGTRYLAMYRDKEVYSFVDWLYKGETLYLPSKKVRYEENILYRSNTKKEMGRA